MKERKQKIFIREFSETMNISKACEKCGIGRTTFYRWKKECSEFREELVNVENIIIDKANGVLFKAMGETGENGFPSKEAIGISKYFHGLLIDKEKPTILIKESISAYRNANFKKHNEKEVDRLHNLEIKELVKEPNTSSLDYYTRRVLAKYNWDKYEEYQRLIELENKKRWA